MSKERCYKIDNLKALLIILVVVGHFIDLYASDSDFYKSIYVCIYAFHMPLFIFISGMFYNPMKAKANSIYYLLMGLGLRYFIQLCRMIMCPGKYEFFFFEEGFIPWYAFALSAFNIISLMLKKVNKVTLLTISMIVACIAGYVDSIDDFLCSSRIIVFFPFFIMGRMISLDKIIELSEKVINKIASYIILFAWAGACFICLYKVYIFRPLFTGRNPYMCNELFHTWGAGYRLMAYIISILTSAALLCVVPNIRIPILSECGKRTLQVFLFHYPLQLIIMWTGIGDRMVTTYIGKIAWILVAVLLAFFLFLKIWSKPIEKMNEKWREYNGKYQASKKKR